MQTNSLQGQKVGPGLAVQVGSMRVSKYSTCMNDRFMNEIEYKGQLDLYRAVAYL